MTILLGTRRNPKVGQGPRIDDWINVLRTWAVDIIMGYQGQFGSGRLRPLLYQADQNENATKESIDAFLADAIPNRQSELENSALRAVETINFLTWSDRARYLDGAIWEMARKMLSSDQITAIVNRIGHSHGTCYAVLAYSTYVGALVAAVIMQLGEADEIRDPKQAIAYSLSKMSSHKELAREWTTEHRHQAFERALSTLPGLAFALLAQYSNDTAEGFMARDAFWRAMLGN